MFANLGRGSFVRLVFARERRIDVRQTNLCARLDHEIFSIVHSGFLPYDVPSRCSNWLNVCPLLLFAAGPKAAKRSAFSRALANRFCGGSLGSRPSERSPVTPQ